MEQTLAYDDDTLGDMVSSPAAIERNADKILQALLSAQLDLRQVARVLDIHRAHFRDPDVPAARILRCVILGLIQKHGLEDIKRFQETHGIGLGNNASRPASLDPFTLTPIPSNLSLFGCSLYHSRHEEVALHLCDQVPSVDLRNLILDAHNPQKEVCTVLHLAAMRGWNNVISKLVKQHGVDPGNITPTGVRPIAVAAARGHKETVEFLYALMLAQGWTEPDILNRAIENPCQPLSVKALESDSRAVLVAVVQKASRITPREWFHLPTGVCAPELAAKGYTLAHHAAHLGASECVRWLLETWPRTFRVNHVVGHEGTMLHIACYAKMICTNGSRLKVVQCLVEMGADVSLRNGHGLTPSQVARSFKTPEVAEYLEDLEKVAAGRRRTPRGNPGTMPLECFKQLEEAAEAVARQLWMEEEEKARAISAISRSGTKTTKKKKRQERARDDTPPQVLDTASGKGTPGEPSTGEKKANREEMTLVDYLEKEAPDALSCPISFQLLDDPVILVADGCTYSRACIQQHLDHCRTRKYHAGLEGGRSRRKRTHCCPFLYHTDHKPLTSPTTNLTIRGAEDARLVDNVSIRAMVLEYKERRTKEWEAVACRRR